MKITRLLTFACTDSEAAIPVPGMITRPELGENPDTEALVIRLFDLLQTRLFCYILTCGLSVHDAQEVLQESFLALFLHLERGRPQTNLTGWLFRVAHNLAIKRRMENFRLQRNLVCGDILPQYPDPGQNAEEQFAFNQTHQSLRAVFEALPELDQQCLHLRSEGLKYREIASILGISLGTVSNLLSRSLTRMMRATGHR